jgi:MarR family transcriptional regulator, organic hydroperoxide resistance regulator
VTPYLDLLSRANKALRAVLEPGLGRHGVRLGQHVVLRELWQNDGRTPGELATALHVTTPTVVKMGQRMEAAGLLTRHRDPDDNRLVRLYLTDTGRALREPLTGDAERLERQLLAGLTADERRHLQAALTKIVANLRALAPPSEE